MVKLSGPRRGSDNYGNGYFGASRGPRTHNGIDFSTGSGDAVLSTVSGEVTKLGYPYGDDLGFRYVQVSTCDSAKHRFFYVLPSVRVGDAVREGSVLGTSQDLSIRYPNGMTQHYHYEIIGDDKQFIDPDEYFG